MIKAVWKFMGTALCVRIVSVAILVFLVVSVYGRTQSWEAAADCFVAFCSIWLLGNGSAESQAVQ